jgi:hypothetical protein
MPALLADGYGVRCQMLEVLELNTCVCHGVYVRAGWAL